MEDGLSPAKCKATRVDGNPCAAFAKDSGLCYWHDPGNRGEMLAASRKGGSRPSFTLAGEAPLNAEEARGILAGVVLALLEGAITPQAANSVAYLLIVNDRLAQSSENEKKIEALEELTNKRRN